MKSQQKQFSSKAKQGGFSILGVILVVVAIVGVLGVWAMSGQTNTATAASSAGDVMASSIVNDGSAIKATFDTLLVNGAAASSITFIPATAGANNILDPSTGIQKPIPNANAVTNTTFPNGAWIYKSAGFKGNGIGTSSDDQAIIIAGVKDGVCEQINNRLYGATTIPASGLASSAFTTGATAGAPSSTNASDLSAVAAVAGWMAGCVTTTGGADNNVYFRVLKAN